MGYVIIRGKEYFIRDGSLWLSREKIRSIREIERLEKYEHLESLDLRENEIEKVVWSYTFFKSMSAINAPKI